MALVLAAGERLRDREETTGRRPAPDAALELLIARKDERLLADAGLTLPTAMGERRFFWAC